MATTSPGVNNRNQDAVAILDSESFQPLFAGANAMRVTVRETSKLTAWPVEDGTERIDHRVVQATEIDMPFLLTDDTRNLYEQMRKAYLDTTLLIVQTKASSYSNMMIYECPHEETPEQGDSIPIVIKMREVRVITPEYGTLPPRKVTNKKQADTVAKGQQQTTSSTDRRASILYGVVN